MVIQEETKGENDEEKPTTTPSKTPQPEQPAHTGTFIIIDTCRLNKTKCSLCYGITVIGKSYQFQ